MMLITRDEVKAAAARDDVTLIKVLDAEQFNHFHLPGAINVALDDDFEERIRNGVPSKSEKIIVYCRDAECPASAEAARRMEALGYEHVYDYERGKMDWKQAGLPIEN